MSDVKHCPRCGQTKPRSDFSRDRHRHDGLDVYCRACRSDKRRERSEGRSKSTPKPISDLKRCPRCGQTKPRSDFPRNRSRRDGLDSHCRFCISDKRKKRRETQGKPLRTERKSTRQELPPPSPPPVHNANPKPRPTPNENSPLIRPLLIIDRTLIVTTDCPDHGRIGNDTFPWPDDPEDWAHVVRGMHTKLHRCMEDCRAGTHTTWVEGQVNVAV